MTADTVCGACGLPATAERRVRSIAHDVQHLMEVLRNRARYVSRTLAWEHVAMGVAEITEIARCVSDLAGELRGTDEVAPIIDVAQSIKQMQTLLRTVAGSDLDVRYRLADGVTQAQLSSGALEQVCINLVANARDAGADTVLISLRVEQAIRTADQEQDEQHIVIEVSDRGGDSKAVPCKEPPRGCVCESTPTWFGTGLRTVNSVAQMAGGTFGMASNIEGGLTATVRIPAV